MSYYSQQRNWADLYLPEQNNAAAHLLLTKGLIDLTFLPPTKADDQRNGIDQVIKVDSMKVSYRIRKFSALEFWRWGFTLRTSGATSELEKIMKQDASYADYLLYSIASPDEPGKLEKSCLIDLKSVGAQLKEIPSILKNEAKFGEGFVDLAYAAFPNHVVVGIV